MCSKHGKRDGAGSLCDNCPSVVLMRHADAIHHRKLRGADNPYSALHARPWIGAFGTMDTFDDIR